MLDADPDDIIGSHQGRDPEQSGAVTLKPSSDQPPESQLAEVKGEMRVSEGAMRTGEAGRPGYVQVEVLGGVYEHVQIPVWLRKQQKTTHTSFICARTHDLEAAAITPPSPTQTPPKHTPHCRLQQISAANGS